MNDNLKSLAVEPFDGKQPQDPFGPIDATLKTDPYARTQKVPTPKEWVQVLVGRRAREWDSLRYHGATRRHPNTGAYITKASVLMRYLNNGLTAIHSKDDADVVLEALQRGINENVDPAETPSVRAARDGALALERQLVMQKRNALP